MLLSIIKLQNLKAIHNKALRAFLKWRSCYESQNYKIWKQFITIHLVKHNKHVVVINHKITKFESNSQQAYTKANQQGCCYQSLNYKIWKQFTTLMPAIHTSVWLLSISKLQNLKSIHNKSWNALLTSIVVINHKTTKFESNSQHFCPSFLRVLSCYQSQNYKIWKQFTTSNCSNFFSASLLSITKLQNLKAIHNLALE